MSPSRQSADLERWARFECADLYGPDARGALAGLGAASLLLDPPRTGAGPALAAWVTPSVRRIAYVSCNPVTFAADASTLRGCGFELVEVGVFDMFPHTAHVETLGVFERRGAAVG